MFSANSSSALPTTCSRSSTVMVVDVSDPVDLPEDFLSLPSVPIQEIVNIRVTLCIRPSIQTLCLSLDVVLLGLPSSLNLLQVGYLLNRNVARDEEQSRHIERCDLLVAVATLTRIGARLAADRPASQLAKELAAAYVRRPT